MTTYQIFFDMFNTIRKNGKERETVALVYQYFDDLIEKSNYYGCSQILSRVELEGMTVKESASFLYITATYKHRIAGWTEFFDKVSNHITRIANAEKAHAMLDDLK